MKSIFIGAICSFLTIYGFAITPYQRVTVSTIWTGTANCTGTGGVSGTATFTVNDGCTSNTNYCRTCLVKTATFTLKRMYPTNYSAAPATVATQTFTALAATSATYSFPNQITQPGFYFVEVKYTSSNGNVSGGTTSPNCLTTVASPVSGQSAGLQYYSINGLTTPVFNPLINGNAISSSQATATPISLGASIIDVSQSWNGADGNTFNPTAQWRVIVTNMANNIPVPSAWFTPFYDGYRFDLRAFISTNFNNLGTTGGVYRLVFEWKNQCSAVFTATNFVNATLVINGLSNASATTPIYTCVGQPINITGQYPPLSSNQYKVTITQCTATGGVLVGAPAPLIYGWSATPPSNLTSLSGSPFAIAANINKFYRVLLEVKVGTTGTTITSTSAFVGINTALTLPNAIVNFETTDASFNPIVRNFETTSLALPLLMCESSRVFRVTSGSGIITQWNRVVDRVASTNPLTYVNAWAQPLSTVTGFTTLTGGPAPPATINTDDIYRITINMTNQCNVGAPVQKIGFFKRILNCKTDGSEETTTDIEEAEQTILVNEIQVYPNPATSSVTVRLTTELAGSQVSLFDMQGKEVLYAQFTTNPTEATFNVSSLAKGVYIVGIQGKKVAKRIIVQ